jgi:hypothetical protein
MNDFATVLPIQKLDYYNDFNHKFQQRINIELENFNRLGLEQYVKEEINITNNIKQEEINTTNNIKEEEINHDVLDTTIQIKMFINKQMGVYYSLINDDNIKKLNFETDFSTNFQEQIKNVFDNLNTQLKPHKKIGLYGSGQLEICYSFFLNSSLLISTLKDASSCYNIGSI